MPRLLALLALLLSAGPALAQSLPSEQAAIKAHVQFLAADALRGREAGTREFEIASEYVAAQMLAAGLEPAGENGGWFQPVRLVTYRAGGKGSLALRRGGADVPLQFGVDFVNVPAPSAPALSVAGPVVFVGYGIVDPGSGFDDYKGLDVRGKVVAMLTGVPGGLPNAVEAHFSDDDQKAALAGTRGARAVLLIESAAQHAQYPFEGFVPYYDYPRTTWGTANGNGFTPAAASPVVAFLSHAGAEKLFAGARIAWRDVLAAERKGARLPRGPLSAGVTATGTTQFARATSRNTVGVLRGSDPMLAAQYIVLSAHLDHVGVGEPVNGDRIYNGAMDNAVGTAAILEVARAFQASGKRPRRSILFVSLTAEEKGLIGSDYFAHHPTVPDGSMVANLNLDMPILTYPLKDVVILGGERSSIGPVAARVAAAEGLASVPDPSPEEMFFVRSDHYSFVKAGIPAVSVDSGPGGEGAAAQKRFLDRNYHKPSDQIDLPFDWNSAHVFVRLNHGIARALADADDRPRWNKGDFFGLQFDGFGAR